MAESEPQGPRIVSSSATSSLPVSSAKASRQATPSPSSTQPRPRIIGVRPAAAGGAIRVRAAKVLRSSSPPTTPISVRARGDRVSEWHTRAVIDFALRVAETMLVTGASAADTTAAVMRIGRAYGMPEIHVDIMYTSVTISFHRGVHKDPITVMRLVSRMGTDYARLESIHELVRDIDAVPGDPGDIEKNLNRLEKIIDRPMAYRRGVITFAWALMGAGVAALLGGTLMTIVLAATSTAIIDRLVYNIARVKVSAFFGQAAGAIFVTTVAAILYAMREQWPDAEWLTSIRPSLVVASSIVALLAGMSVVTAAQDTLDGFYVTASARTYEVVLLTGGIVTGVLLTLSVSARFGVKPGVIPSTALADSLTVQILASAAIATGSALGAYCGPVAIIVSGLVGAGSWTLYSLAGSVLNTSYPLSCGLATFGIGLLAPRLARRLQVPSIAITTASIAPLLPGLAVYRGIIGLTSGVDNELTPFLITAALVGLALSVGVSLGTLLGRQLMAREGSITAQVVAHTVADVGDEYPQSERS